MGTRSSRYTSNFAFCHLHLSGVNSISAHDIPLASRARFSTSTVQGKTFIVANVIQKASLPTLVLAPNKVLGVPGSEYIGRE